MMLQHNNNADAQAQYRNAVYAMFVELADVTDALTEKTDSDDFEDIQSLVQRREVCIRQLSVEHTMERRNIMMDRTEDEQMKEIVSRVKHSSERMQSVMEQKSKMLIMNLTNLQNQKMYQQ